MAALRIVFFTMGGLEPIAKRAVYIDETALMAPLSEAYKKKEIKGVKKAIEVAKDLVIPYVCMSALAFM